MSLAKLQYKAMRYQHLVVWLLGAMHDLFRSRRQYLTLECDFSEGCDAMKLIIKPCLSDLGEFSVRRKQD